jgi:hypothetical protein
MKTDGEIDRLLRDEAERWRTGVSVSGDVEAGRFTDISTPSRIPRTLIAALSTAALAAVFVAVIGSRWMPVVDPIGTATPGVPGAEATPDPLAGLEVIRPGDTVTARGAMVVHKSGDVFLCPTSAIALLPAGVDVDAVCLYAPLLPLRGVDEGTTFIWATVVGTWDGSSVDVQRISEADRPDLPWSDRSVSCEPPVGGWPGNPDDDQAVAVLDQEVRENPSTYVGMWSAQAMSEMGDSVRVMAVGTVDDLETAKRRLTETYPFNLCVVDVDFSLSELEDVTAELAALEGPNLRLDVDAASDRVVVWTNALDLPTAEAILPFLDKIEVRATLQLVRASPEATNGVEPIIVCGRIDREDCEASIAIVRGQHEAPVESARAIVVDDSCPPTMACDRAYPFAVLVVLMPVNANEAIQAFQVVGTDGPEEIVGSSPFIPQHIQDLISTVSPSPPPVPSACDPGAFLEAARMVVYDYEPVDSPRELARMSDLVVIGRVVAGTAVANEQRGFDTHLAVHVSEVVRGDPELVLDGRIFVVLHSVDISAIDAIQKMSGCDVLLFLTRHQGAFAPGAQGFWIQSDEGLIGVHVPIEGSPPGWHEIASIDDLVAASAYTVAEREAAMVEVTGAMYANQDDFGIPWLADDGALVVQYVDEAARAALEEQVDPAVTVRWERVTYSRSELRRIAREISDLDLDGISGISSGTKENRAVVGIGPGGSVEDVSELLTARYGDAVRVEFSPYMTTLDGGQEP